MVSRTPKKVAGNLPVGSAMRRKVQKGNSTPKAKKTRSAPRFFEVKIRITADEYTRGKSYFQKQKYLTRFVLDAYTEKVNRAEAKCKAARLRILAGNMDLLEPILKEMFQQGKLNFLKEQNGSDT
jgi:hypothetical protein